MAAACDVKGLLARAQEQESAFLDMLADLVQIESPSDDKVAVDTAVGWVMGLARSRDWMVRRHRQTGVGDCLELFTAEEDSGEKAVLLLGHLDTVWPKGTIAKMPCRIEKRRVFGPGVLDMKAGVVMGLLAVDVLRAEGAKYKPVRMLLVGDEEIGSPVSRPLTERIAQECEAVYVLEPAQGAAGAYKTARKGIGMYRLEVTGVAAHSGVDFSSGHSANLELARQLNAMHALCDLDRGVTLNAGVMGGGTKSNVVAASAWAEIDVRVQNKEDAEEIERRLFALTPQDPACRLAWSGGMNRPPMERTAATLELYRKARQVAASIEVELEEAATGGGSDGNFTSALGVPTLDGMGAVGEGAHADSESIDLEKIASRVAILAGMLC